MNVQVIHVKKLPAAKMAAALSPIVAIPYELLSDLRYLPQLQAAEWGMLALSPLVYAAAAFLLTLLATAIYNGFAARFGGIEFTTVEEPVAAPEP